MSRQIGYVSGFRYEKRVERFTADGTFTPPAGVSYAIAHIRAGGGGIGRAGAGGPGGTSSVAFAGGTISATGGGGCDLNHGAPDGQSSTAGQANSGMGAFMSINEQSLGGGMAGQAIDGAYIVAGGAVTAGVGITVTVGAGGTAGSNGGAAGGSGYVWIEYEQPIGAGL